MRKYKVVLSYYHTADLDQVVDGCLGNIFGSGKIELYDHKIAINKALLFGGFIEEVIGIHNVIGKLSLQTIPKDALLDGVLKALEGREAFKDADIDNDEYIYYGGIFNTIAEEITQNNQNMSTNEKVIDQLNELAKLITANYVLITNS